MPPSPKPIQTFICSGVRVTSKATFFPSFSGPDPTEMSWRPPQREEGRRKRRRREGRRKRSMRRKREGRRRKRDGRRKRKRRDWMVKCI